MENVFRLEVMQPWCLKCVYRLRLAFFFSLCFSFKKLIKVVLIGKGYRDEQSMLEL